VKKSVPYCTHSQFGLARWRKLDGNDAFRGMARRLVIANSSAGNVISHKPVSVLANRWQDTNSPMNHNGRFGNPAHEQLGELLG